MMTDNINSLSDITKMSEDIRSEVNKSIVGLTNHIDTLTLSLLTGGHVLLGDYLVLRKHFWPYPFQIHCPLRTIVFNPLLI